MRFSSAGLPGLFILLVAFAAPPAWAQDALPTFSKSFSPATIAPGGVSTLTFVIDNTSGASTRTLSFTDSLPADVTVASPANLSNGCGGAVTATSGTQLITFNGSGVVGGASCAISVDVTSSTVGTHTNTSSLLTTDFGTSGPAVADLEVSGEPGGGPEVSKAFAPSSVSLGDRSRLTITIDNTTGSLPINFLQFTDNLPAGMVVANPANPFNDCGATTTVTAVPGSGQVSLSTFGFSVLVAAGESCSVAVDVVATAGGVLNNVVSVQGSINGGPTVDLGGASASLTVNVAPLTITKQFTDDPARPGGTVSLKFEIFKRDRNSIAEGLAFSDDLSATLAGLTVDSVLSNGCGGSFSGADATLIDFTGGTIAEGIPSCAILLSLAVPSDAVPGAYPNTTSTVSGSVGGSPITGNQASDTLFISPSPLLTKMFLDNPVSPGATTTLQFSATNTSATSSATALTFTDELPVILGTAASVPGNNCCGDGSTCAFTPLLDSGVGTTPASMTVTNGTLGPGESCTFDLTLNVDADAPGGAYENVTSEISATIDGVTRTGAPATDILEVVTTPVLSKRFIDDPVAPGGAATLEFMLTLGQEATSGATAIAFTDDLAPVLSGLVATNLPLVDPCGAGSSLTGSAGNTMLEFDGGSLGSGESCTFQVVLDVPSDAAPGSYPNTTSMVMSSIDGFEAVSAAATDNLRVQGLVFTKEFIDDPVIPGGTTTLRFTIENVHPTDEATSVAFSDNLNATLSGLAATGTPTVSPECGVGASISGTSNLSFSGGSVLSGETCTIDVDVLVPASAADGTYPNTTSLLTATQSGTGVVVDPATDALLVESNLLQITKQFTDDPAFVGGTVTLEFTLTNLDAANAASSIAFSDDLSVALGSTTARTPALFDDCGGSFSPALPTGDLQYSGGSLAAGASCTIQLTLDLDATLAGTFLNTTSPVTGTISGLPVSGAPASDTLRIAALTFSKAFSDPTFPGGTVDLTFSIQNNSGSTISDIAFTDDLNTVISGLTATPPADPNVCGGAFSVIGSSLLSLSGGELLAGAGCTIVVELTVPAGAANGSYLNRTGSLRVAGSPAAPAATAILIVGDPPPNVPPVADAGEDQTVECGAGGPAPGFACVTLNGGGSTDPDNGPGALTYEWTGPFSEGGGAVTGVNPKVTLPLGTSTVTLVVFDGEDFSAPDTVDITVVDTAAPVITVVTDPPIRMAPPNHTYRTFTVADFVTGVSDGCDSSVSLEDVYITSVSSDEPEEDPADIGDGDTLNDIVISPGTCQSVDLRRERRGSGNGRVYTITFAAVDGSGNVGTNSVKVHVPQSPVAAVIDDGPIYSVSCTPGPVSPPNEEEETRPGKRLGQKK